MQPTAENAAEKKPYKNNKKTTQRSRILTTSNKPLIFRKIAQLFSMITLNGKAKSQRVGEVCKKIIRPAKLVELKIWQSLMLKRHGCSLVGFKATLNLIKLEATEYLRSKFQDFSSSCKVGIDFRFRFNFQCRDFSAQKPTTDKNKIGFERLRMRNHYPYATIKSA